MRQFTVKPKLQVIEDNWLIEIYPYNSVEGSTSILNTRSNEYQSFIEGMIDMFDYAGYELYRDPKYTHHSDSEGSQSEYYTFLKIEDSVAIRVVVHVRISDHANKDKKWGTARERRSRYVHKIAEELAEEYKVDPIPLSVPIEIIFDNEKYFKSYPSALSYVRKQIIETDEDFEDWKEENGL